jgi:hypothetical protein
LSVVRPNVIVCFSLLLAVRTLDKCYTDTQQEAFIMNNGTSMLSYELRWHTHKPLVVENSWPGCVDGCKHRTDDKREETIECPFCKKVYTRTQIGPLCSINENVLARRTSIFATAQALVDENLALAKIQAAHNQWRKVTSEFYDLPCPFAEISGQS